MMSSCPLQPQLATMVMMPWTTSGVTLCSMSGSAMVMLKDTVGILPCPRPNSLIFSRPSLARGGGRGLEDELETAIGQQVRIGQGQYRQLRAFRPLGDGERE